MTLYTEPTEIRDACDQKLGLVGRSRPAYFDRKLSETDIPLFISNGLRDNGIITVDDLRLHNAKDLKDLPRIGKTAVKNLETLAPFFGGMFLDDLADLNYVAERVELGKKYWMKKDPLYLDPKRHILPEPYEAMRHKPHKIYTPGFDWSDDIGILQLFKENTRPFFGIETKEQIRLHNQTRYQVIQKAKIVSEDSLLTVSNRDKNDFIAKGMSEDAVEHLFSLFDQVGAITKGEVFSKKKRDRRKNFLAQYHMER